MGSNEAVAVSIADHGLPISVVADDSSFPELFEHLRKEREQWSVTLIKWRNLRGIFDVLRKREMLGLLVDWGYRADGIPVRLFGSWTTLPAGPATLAAKTRSWIVSVHIRRRQRRQVPPLVERARSWWRPRTRPSSSVRPRRWPTSSPRS